ncbi:MAG: hypothetical protein ACO28O_08685, partial [Crocinitomicaceae bacterium]
MKSNLKHLIYLLFFGTLFLSACGDGQYKTLYHQTVAFPDHQWKNTIPPISSSTTYPMGWRSSNRISTTPLR